MKEILCEFHRNGDVESVHRVSLIAVEKGKPAMVCGSVDHPVFMRSCAKPFQGLTVVESGAADAYGFSADEIAVVCGSHPGEPEHVRAASSILKKAKLTVGHLQCGAHLPSGSRGLRELIRAGKEPTAIHNNCSGKHSGMVSAARFMRAPLDSYLKPGHPLQKANVKNVARFAGMKPAAIEIGIDGCSAPTFGLPLRAMARAIASFSSDPGTPQRVRDAMMAHPAMVGRPCVTLMSAAPGRLLAKGGAEGVYLCGFPGREAGLALKVEDGNARAWVHVLHAVIRKLGWLDKEDLGRLSKAADPDLKNHAGRRVGEIRVNSKKTQRHKDTKKTTSDISSRCVERLIMVRCVGVLLMALLGAQDDALKPFDEPMEAQLKLKTPGGALAVAKDGRLVYAKGFGLGDVVNKAPVEPTSLFRIASLSKPITAVAVLKLVQDGKLDLDAKAFSLLGLKAPEGTTPDPRLAEITVRHLLQHTGGWNRDKSGDPMFMAGQISKALGVPSPPTSLHIVRYMMGRPLDLNPGTKFAYSNFGYCVLGRIIEQLTGETYDNHVKKAVLAPMGITRMTLGRSLRENREKDEVTYYPGAAKPAKPVFDSLQVNDVPAPYGSFCLEAMDAHGGWIASVVDLVKFASSLDKVLNAKSLELMFAKPSNAGNTPTYYGCGWMVRPVGVDGKANTWHIGSLPGSSTLLVRRHDGLVWAAVFNERIKDDQFDPSLHRAADAVKEWPKEDLFEKYR